MCVCVCVCVYVYIYIYIYIYSFDLHMIYNLSNGVVAFPIHILRSVLVNKIFPSRYMN